MKSHKIAFLLCAVLLLTALSGCSSGEPVPISISENSPKTLTPDSEPEPATEPMKEPSVVDVDTEGLKKAYYESWDSSVLTLDTLSGYHFGSDMRSFIKTKNSARKWVAPFAEEVNSELSKAAAKALRSVKNAAGCKVSVLTGTEIRLDWQAAYSALLVSSDAEEASRKILAAARPVIEFVPFIHSLGIKIEADAFPYLKMMERIAEGNAENLETARFAYNYTKTLYDENGATKDYVLPEAEGNLKSGITWPLKSHTCLRKTWYASRDKGTRRHTGTDIKAAANTEIYSCTDGTVTGVYSARRSGNSVVVTDEYGYEFHYYHMIRLTDFLKAGDKVSAGDLVGHVGSTGNSACNHLHLTIVAPDGTFINPYPYLLEVEP